MNHTVLPAAYAAAIAATQPPTATIDVTPVELLASVVICAQRYNVWQINNVLQVERV